MVRFLFSFNETMVLLTILISLTSNMPCLVLIRPRLGLDYRHGTGHGVGAFLNVHEGPQGVGQAPRRDYKVG